jgi:peptidoglycan/xylan/chitin deacetylase (PgdA/CDA1 family)
MSRHRALLLISLLTLVIAAPASAARKREAGPVILCYHNIGQGHGIHSISRQTFVQQISYLKDHGYNVISLSTLSELLGRGVELPLNTVVVTVDDGWRSTMTEVLPVMKSYGFPFTAFIYPRFVTGEGSSLSWDEIRKLMKEGVDVQSHTYSHAFLTRKRQRSRSGAEYSSWLWRELAGSRREIEKQTGKAVRFLAYPYGDYDSRVAAAAAAAGYAAALTCNEGPIVAGADAYRLRRFAIDRTTSFDQFKSYVGRSGKGTPRKPGKLASLAPRVVKKQARKGVIKAPVAAVSASAFIVSSRKSGILPLPVSQSEDSPSASPIDESVAAIVRTRRDIEAVDEESDDA